MRYGFQVKLNHKYVIDYGFESKEAALENAPKDRRDMLVFSYSRENEDKVAKNCLRNVFPYSVVKDFYVFKEGKEKQCLL